MGTPQDTNQAAGSLYDTARIRNEYALMPGVCILPLAEDPPTDPIALANYSPVVIGRLHAPYRLRKFEFGDKKERNPPVIPTPQDVGKFIFVGGTIQFDTDLNTTFWDYNWTVNGTYLLVENCVSRIQDGFVLGSMPFATQQDVANEQQYSTQPPAIGAISEAGIDAITGYYAGQTIVGQTSNGQLIQFWSYTSPQFFPGQLFNDSLANGGIS